MKYISQIDVKNRRVLIRVDFNVPLLGGIVANDFRIRAALPTIKYCLSNGASVVLMSHLGRPNGKEASVLSLDPVIFSLEELLDTDVYFSDDCISDEAINFSRQLNPGEVHLLENLRFHEGEVENDKLFSARLSLHGDMYVNDAFGTAHRAHASNVGVLEFMKEAYPGLLLEKEEKYLTESINSPTSPYVVVLGGAKVKGKIELIQNLMKSADSIIIGGAMAFTFLKVLGKNVGKSLIDIEGLPIAEKLLNDSEKMNVPLVLPVDVVAAKKVSDGVPWDVTTLANMDKRDIGLDIGPESTLIFESHLASANTILWNGPMGVFEIPAYSTGTQAIASMIRDRTLEGAVTIVGGGDTATAVEEFGMRDEYTHVSTGGGASLELLSGKNLPAFEALRNHG